MTTALINQIDVSEEVHNIGFETMNKVKAGKIKQHKLSNSAFAHTGEIENKELAEYIRFLPSKNCQLLLDIKGNEIYE